MSAATKTAKVHKDVTFYDCPDCGTSKLATFMVFPAMMTPHFHLTKYPQAKCPGCREAKQPDYTRNQGCGSCHRIDWKYRRTISVMQDGKAGKCGGACLSGKRSCDCSCAGLCHGQGTCKCS